MISKELLSEVLNKNITGFLIEEGVLFYSEEPNKPPRWETWVNIHELAHKCKEWAFDKGYRLMSCQDKNDGYCEVMEAKHYPPMLNSWSFDTEPEAIFKACEWIRLHVKEQS